MPMNYYVCNKVNIMSFNFLGKLSKTQLRGIGQPHKIRKNAQKGFYTQNLPWI